METAVGERSQDDVQRWTTKRKDTLVLSLLKGETNMKEAALQHSLRVAELEDWKERFLLAAESSAEGRRGPIIVSAVSLLLCCHTTPKPTLEVYGEARLLDADHRSHGGPPLGTELHCGASGRAQEVFC